MTFAFHCPKCGHSGVERAEEIRVRPDSGATSWIGKCFRCTNCFHPVPTAGLSVADLDRWMLANPPPKPVEAVFKAVYLGSCPHCDANTSRQNAGPTKCGLCSKEYTVVTK